jgi:hypothetical protein
MRTISEFRDYEISENGDKVTYQKNVLQIVNNKIVMKHDEREIFEEFFIWEIVLLAYHHIPLETGYVLYRDGNKNNNNYKNLSWQRNKINYLDDKILSNVKYVHLLKHTSHCVTNEGRVFNYKTGNEMAENYEFVDGRGRIFLPYGKFTDKIKNIKQVLIDELVGDIFIKKPQNAIRLIHKNGLFMDNRVENLEWEIKKEIPIKLVLKINKPEYIKENKIEENIFKVDPKDVPEEHDPFYEEFEISENEDDYDLDDCFELNSDGIKWKTAKFKGNLLKCFYISENMDLYSKYKKKIITPNINQLGEKSYRFEINKKSLTIHLKDILASTFLKHKENPETSVYKHWNKDNSKGKYFNQTTHYKNLKWLYEEDFINIGDPKNCFKLSKHGDLYTKKQSTYTLHKEDNLKNQLRIIKNNSSLTKNIHLHYETALAFVHRPDESYKYCLHKDGDPSNNHYRNLVWLKTLSGIHNDGIRYFEVPNFPEYALSETNLLNSFKNGIFKTIKIQNDGKGYKKIHLYDKNNTRRKIRFHRLVGFVRNKDFNPDLPIHHLDKLRDNNFFENLKSVTTKENNNDRNYFQGKEIIQLDDDENILKIHKNAKVAAQELGDKYNYINIRRCAFKNNKNKNKKHKCGDFIWRYLEKREKYVCKEGEYFVILYGNFQGVVLEYENLMISNFGTIINVNKGYAKKYNIIDYPETKLINNGKIERFTVHKLVALVFVKGKTDERNEIHHIDENILNFKSDNLIWVTHEENMNFSSYRFGKPVKQICMETGNVIGIFNTRVEAAKFLEKSASNINTVCNLEGRSAYGFYWKDIPEEEIKNYPELILNKK